MSIHRGPSSVRGVTREPHRQQSSNNTVKFAKRSIHARGTSEYRKAYDSVTNFVGKIDEHNAKRICYESPAASK